jgi:hypothetical protein
MVAKPPDYTEKRPGGLWQSMLSSICFDTVLRSRNELGTNVVVDTEQRGGGLTLGVIGQGAWLWSIQLGSLGLSRVLGEQRALISD